MLEFVNWIFFFKHNVDHSCFSPALADLLDKVVAHQSNSSAECFFSPVPYKGQ